MRTLTSTFNVYEFNELSEQAKENARWRYLREYRTAEDLHDLFVEDLIFNVGVENASVSFCLGHIQGDFVHIDADIPSVDKERLEREYAQWGYDYFDIVEDSEIEHVAEMLDLVFYEDGSFESEEKACRRLK